MKKLPMLAALAILPYLQALPLSNPMDSAILTDGLLNDDCTLSSFFHLPAICQKINYRLGFYGDYVFERNIEILQGLSQSADNKDLLKTCLNTQAALISLNYNDRWEVFGTLGASSLAFKGDCKVFNVRPRSNLNPPLSGTVSVNTNPNFSWSLGSKGVLWSFGCTQIGFEAQYFCFKSNFKTIEMSNNLQGIFSSPPAPPLPNNWVISMEGLSYPNSLLSANYKEWQLGLGMAHQVGWAIPYAGIKAASARLDMDNAKLGIQSATIPGYPTNTSPIFYNGRSAKTWGYAIGCSIAPQTKGEFTIEGRFGDEKACYVDCQFRF
jgi:major outer membrane protein